MRWIALALVLAGLAGMFLPVVGVDLGDASPYAPPIGLVLVALGSILLTRSLRQSGIGLSDPRAWRRFRGNKGALAGGILVLAVIVTSFAGPLLAPYDP